MTRWYTEKKREHFYKEAKRQGYRARSAFKLKQIQRRFAPLHKGDIVLDLGAAPGGWSQVASEIVGPTGTVIGIDLSPIRPLNGVRFLRGDLTEDTTINALRELLGKRDVDVVLSDMSPDISGVYSIDHARSIYLCEHAVHLAQSFLKPKGCFVCKVFTGSSLNEFIAQLHTIFEKIYQFSPPASRKSSSELYLIARDFHRDIHQ